MAYAALQVDVARVQARSELGGQAQVGAGCQDAEAAPQPRHAGGIGPVRRLAGVPDDPEHIVGREIEDRQPVEDLAAGDAHAVVAAPGNLPGPCCTLLGAHAHSVHKAAAEAGIGLEIAAQLALDRRSLVIARTVRGDRRTGSGRRQGNGLVWRSRTGSIQPVFRATCEGLADDRSIERLRGGCAGRIFRE